MSTKDPFILPGHRRRGKRLVPPLLDMMGDRYMPYSWAREILPEVIWIVLIVETFGIKEGAALAIELMRACNVIESEDRKPLLSLLSSYQILTEEQKLAALAKLGSDKTQKISKGLQPLHQLCPNNPLSFLNKVEILEAPALCREKLEYILPRLYDRSSRESAVAMAVAIYIGAVQGVIHFAGNLAAKFGDDLDHIVDYPRTERSKAAAASFRASAPMLLSPLQKNEDHDSWLEYFWASMAGFGSCIPETPPETEEIPDDPVGKAIFSFRNAVRNELFARIRLFGFNLNDIEPYEVVGALLARQATLAMEIALTPNCWTSHLAPMLLRGMADVHITLTWIFGGLEERSKRFVDDGLGAVKLEVAHRKRELDDESNNDDPSNVKRMKEELVFFWEKWLESRRIDHLVEVNLGTWSGLSTRRMAEDSANISFYNYVFQPFSAAVHSNWAHVSTHNMKYCENPAHRFHRTPTVVDEYSDVFWLYLAGKYLEKTFAAFDIRFDIVCDQPKAFEVLLKCLEENFASDPED